MRSVELSFQSVKPFYFWHSEFQQQHKHNNYWLSCTFYFSIGFTVRIIFVFCCYVFLKQFHNTNTLSYGMCTFRAPTWTTRNPSNETGMDFFCRKCWTTIMPLNEKERNISIEKCEERRRRKIYCIKNLIQHFFLHHHIFPTRK